MRKYCGWFVAVAALALSGSPVWARSTQIVRIGDVETIPNGIVTPPRILNFAYPAYTYDAYRRRIEGNVTVEVSFRADGRFDVLRVVKGLGYGLDAKAVEVLHDWQFLPATQNGVPVSVIARIDVDFNLLRNPVMLTGYSFDMAPPRIDQRVAPQYSAEALAAGFQGDVLLEVIVDESGVPTVNRIIRRVGLGLDEKAVEALEQWRFRPATKGGEPIRVVIKVEVNFRNERGSANLRDLDLRLLPQSVFRGSGR
jgi:TonB family protein